MHRDLSAPEPDALAQEREPPAPLDEARRVFERAYLVRVLTLTGGNVTRAARLAGRNRTEFYRLLERHSLAPSMFKEPPAGPDGAGGVRPRSVP
jgi:two-component system response regulator GlrR